MRTNPKRRTSLRTRRNQWHWHQGGPSWMVSRGKPSSSRHVAPDYKFRTERDAAKKAQDLADETGERWWTWEADLSTRRVNPKGATKFDRCVKAVSRSRSAADPRAVCGAMRKRGTLKRGNGLFDFARKVRKRSARGYMVLDSDNYPVHTGRNLTKRQALQIAREARKEGERVHLARFKENTPKRKNRGARNPIPAAQERYEKFHGHPSKELIEVKTRVHQHSVLSALGELKQLKIRAQNGTAVVTVKGFKGAILCQNEKATQLFIEGGDQSVNLADFGIRQPYHEKEVLGECTDVYYFTTKDHLAPQDGGTAVYHHKFGGKRIVIRNGKEKRVRSPKPTIVYDVPNGLLEFAGGGYTIPDEGIDG